MGQCRWCAQFVPDGLEADGKVGCIETVEPASGITMPFFVFFEGGQWHCSMWSPQEQGNTCDVTCFSDLGSDDSVPHLPAHTDTLPHLCLGRAELVLGRLHPCLHEAVRAKDEAVEALLEKACQLNAAASLLLYALDKHIPEHVGDAHTYTELAVCACKEAIEDVLKTNREIRLRVSRHLSRVSRHLSSACSE